MIRLFVALLLTLVVVSAANAQSTITAQIHNAPGWQASHTYTYSGGPPTAPYTRIVAGAGWTPGSPGSYNVSQTLNAYQLKSTSTSPCVSASSYTVGNWTTSSSISDGTCTWQYVSSVDYVSLTGWGFDATPWTSGMNVGYMDVVETNDPGLPVYQQIAAGCNSTAKPTGSYGTNPASGTVLSDGCVWYGPIANVTYSSRAKRPPMESFYYDSFQGTVSGTTLTVTTPPSTWPVVVGQYINFQGISSPQTNWRPFGIGVATVTASCGTNCWTLSQSAGTYSGTIYNSIEGNTCNTCTDGGQWNANNFYVADLWNDQVYLAGANGENSGPGTYNHNYEYNDAFHFFEVTVPANCVASGGFGCPNEITAAPGESFQDTFGANPSLALGSPSVNNGVFIHATATAVDGLDLADNILQIDRLQVKADLSAAIPDYQRACNECQYHHNIVEGLGDTSTGGVIITGAFGSWFNNLIIADTGVGIGADYGGFVYNNTIVCPSGTCVGAAVANTKDWINPMGTILSGNAMFGFAHLVASSGNDTNSTNCNATTVAVDCTTWTGTNNATDIASTDGNNYPATTFFAGVTWYVQNFQTGRLECSIWTSTTHIWGDISPPIIPSTCAATNSLSPSSVFMSWPGNYKINSSSPLYGTGASFGSVPNDVPYNPVMPDTPDIAGTARPQGSRFDIGAFEVPNGGTNSAGRPFFR